MIGSASGKGPRRRGPSGRVGESRAGVSLNGLLALVCGFGLLLVRDGLISTASPDAQTSVRILLWLAVVVLHSSHGGLSLRCELVDRCSEFL